MRIFIMLLITIVNLILQSTFNVYFDKLFISPNTMLVLVISYSIARNDIEGALFGFVNGLLFDIFFGRIIGFYALIGLLIGFIAAKPFKELSPNNFIMPSVMVFSMTIIYETSFYIFGFLLRGRTDFLFYLINIILPEAIFNCVISLAIYPIIYFINKRLEEHEKPKRKMFSSIGGNSGKI